MSRAILLAIALAIMTIDICRCLQELDRCSSKADSELQAEMKQWLAIAIRPSKGLHTIVALWIVLATLHIRSLHQGVAVLAGQLVFALIVLGIVARWERLNAGEIARSVAQIDLDFVRFGSRAREIVDRIAVEIRGDGMTGCV